MEPRGRAFTKIAALVLAALLAGGGCLPRSDPAQTSRLAQDSDPVYEALNGIDRRLHREARLTDGTRQATTPIEQLKAKYDLSPRAHACPVYFGQAGVQPRFSRAGRFKGAPLQDIIAKLHAGELTPDDLPVEFIWVDGKRVAVNNRSLTPLYKAGLRPTRLIDRTGNLPADGPDTLERVLQRLEGMAGKPSTEMFVRTRGLGRDGLMKESSDWAAPVGEIVSMPDDQLALLRSCQQADTERGQSPAIFGRISAAGRPWSRLFQPDGLPSTTIESRLAAF